MKRYLRPLIALVLVAAVALLAGCSSLFEVDTDALEDALTATPVPEATPIPELTAPLYEDYDAVFAHYNEVSITGDTLVTLKERYGEPKVEEDDNGNKMYTWLFEDGYGFTCAAFPSGSLRAKVVFYEDMRQFRALSDASNLDSVVNFDKSINFQTCVGLFRGRPIEIAQIVTEENSGSASRVYCWLDAQDQIVQILFKSDGTVDSISYQLND